jgi:hypothetical protein
VRRWRRRAWPIVSGVAVLLGGVAGLVVLAVARGDPAKTPAGPGPAGVLPLGPFATLHVAGPLAVAPDGALYVADMAADRVLVRLPDERFRVTRATAGRASPETVGLPSAPS